MTHSTARKGAMTVRNKAGKLLQPIRPIGTEIPMNRIRWVLSHRRIDPLFGGHECDFSPLFSGCPTSVCACGKTQGGEL